MGAFERDLQIALLKGMRAGAALESIRLATRAEEQRRQMARLLLEHRSLIVQLRDSEKRVASYDATIAIEESRRSSLC